jgi:SAM-dependent methyltransferase
VDLSDNRYGDDWAEDYDALMPIPDCDTAAAVDFLASRAGGGPVLELAAGTGRLAIPLARRGLAVTATDSSQAMLDRLGAKDSTHLVTTRLEAMPVVSGGPFTLIYCAYSSITCLHTQPDQLELLCAAAGQLTPGGALVIETALVDPRSFVEAKALAMTGDALMARFGRYDVATQVLDQYYLIARPGQQVSIRPDSGRMVTPAELDLMARIAGLTTCERYASWHRAPATGAGNVVSVFGRGR